MIIKQKNGTVLEMTPEEFAELGGVLDDDAVAEGNAEVTAGFKAGDEVEVIGKSIFYNDKYIEKKGVVTFVFSVSNIRVDTIGTGERFFPQSSLKLIEEEPEEVLSEDNVKFGEYFVVTGNNNHHMFAIGEVIKAKSHTGYARFKAQHMGESNWWYVKYTDVRRATAEEIAEATKPKEVKFEIGDVVKVGAFDFATITQDIDPDGDYPVKYIENGSFNFAEPSNIRHATEEEKSHLQTLIGREKYEYKIGDLVELLDGFGSNFSGLEGCFFEIKAVGVKGVTIKRCNTTGEVLTEKLAWIIASNLKLITPVKWRHDFI